MKKVSILFLCLIALGSIFTSCNPNIDSPEISVTPSNTTVYYVPVKAGQVVTFTAVMTPDVVNGAELMTLKISDGTEETTMDLGGANVQITKTYDYTVSETINTETTITLTFEVFDTNQNSKDVKVYIKVTEDDNAFPELVSYNGTLNYISTSLNNTMMFICGTAGSMGNGNDSNADLAFVWQDGNGYSVCSPDAGWIAECFSYNNIVYSTSDKNHTKIAPYSGSYSALTAEILDGLTISYESQLSGAGNGINNVSNGDLISFITADGQKGVLKVVSNSKVSKYMQFEAKFQKTGSSGK
jgi:hypothetical protein